MVRVVVTQAGFLPQFRIPHKEDYISFHQDPVSSYSAPTNNHKREHKKKIPTACYWTARRYKHKFLIMDSCSKGSKRWLMQRLLRLAASLVLAFALLFGAHMSFAQSHAFSSLQTFEGDFTSSSTSQHFVSNASVSSACLNIKNANLKAPQSSRHSHDTDTLNKTVSCGAATLNHDCATHCALFGCAQALGAATLSGFTQEGAPIQTQLFLHPELRWKNTAKRPLLRPPK